MKTPQLLFTVFLTAISFHPVTAAETKPPRAARSVHLSYPAPDATLFYNEAVVEQSVPGSYFMVCGWNTGYCGIQHLANGNKTAIFSVWDSAKGDVPDNTPLEKRVEVLYSGEGVQVSRFGGEGTGGKSMFPYTWKIGDTNRFLIQARVDGPKTAYTGWLFLNDQRQWKKLVTFRTTTGGQSLRGFHSFVEDFRRDTKSATEVRRARFGDGWVKTAKDEWVALARARFTASSADWEARESINAGSMPGGWFFLATGGDTVEKLPLNGTISVPPRGLDLPDLDLGK